MENSNGNAVTQATTQHRDNKHKWLAPRLARARTETFTEIATVTPEIAQVIMTMNDENRPLVKSNLARWMKALSTGAWELNGETIKISDTGELNDGQHRLTAVIRTGIPAPFIIVWGVSRSSRRTVDTGAKRTGAHVLSMSGFGNANIRANAIKVVLNYNDGVSLSTHRENTEVLDAAERMPKITDSMRFGIAVGRMFRVSSGGMVAMHYIMARRNTAKADQFFSALAGGIGTSPKDPVVMLRNRLMQQLTAKAKLPFPEVAAITIKAFNAYTTGKPIGALRWRTEGEAPETFPRIR